MNKVGQKTISIIIPAYNVEKYLNYSVESILNQSYKNLEIIIVNDGSSDATARIIKELEEKDGRIKSVHHEENKGLFQTRITGVEASSGDYIAFVDADDSVSVDWFRLLLKKAEETQADIVLANTISKNDKKEMYIDNVSYFMTRKKYELDNEQILDYLMEDEGMCFSLHTVWNKIYSRELWNRSLPSLKKITKHFIMTEDIAFSVVLHYFAKRLAYSNHDGYFYYRNVDSSTISTNGVEKLKKNIADIKLSFDFVAEFLKEHNLYEKYEEKYLNWKNRYFRWWSYIVKINTINGTEEELNICNEFLDYFNKEEFEEAHEEDAFFTDVTTTWNDKLEKLKKLIMDDSIEYVSFDIFDTLVVRPFLEPTDLYVFMEEEFQKLCKGNMSFKDIRLNSEKKCRRQMQITAPAYQDVSLTEIYEQMSKDYNISLELCNVLKEKEETLEIRFCSVRKTSKELYEFAHAVGKKVILTSDMYLEEECINTILKKNGYNLHEKLFLSSKERFLKYKGDLFRVALKTCNILPESLLHIGDNWNVDFNAPQALGCRSYFFPKTKDILFNTLGDEYTGNAIRDTFNNFNAIIDKSVIMKSPIVRCLYALVANEIFDNPYVSFNPVSNYNRDSYFIGYFPVGMHLLGIIKWMVRELNIGKYKKIHFIARDGYLPKKMYDVVRKYEPLLPESNYIYASRKSMITAAIRSAYDLENIKNNCSVYGQTPESIYKIYADVLKPLDETMENVLLNKGILIDKKFGSEDEFQYFIDILKEFAFDETKAKKNFENCSNYFKSQISIGDVTFDLGYSGKLQSSICTALDFPVDVFFLHTNGFETNMEAKHSGYKVKSYYDYSTPMSGIVNEFIFSDYAPSCIGYSSDGKLVSPVFETKKIDYQEKFLLDEIALGCEKFINDFYETFNGYIHLFEYQPMDTSLPYEGFMNNPKWFDINLLKCIYLEDEYYGGISRSKMAEHWWWQMNYKAILLEEPKYSSMPIEPPVQIEQPVSTELIIPVRPELENLYADGVFVSFYKMINNKYPVGSKGRERIKKIAKLFFK